MINFFWPKTIILSDLIKGTVTSAVLLIQISYTRPSNCRFTMISTNLMYCLTKVIQDQNLEALKIYWNIKYVPGKIGKLIDIKRVY